MSGYVCSLSFIVIVAFISLNFFALFGGCSSASGLFVVIGTSTLTSTSVARRSAQSQQTMSSLQGHI